MPIYDYACKKCKIEKAVFKKSFDDYQVPPTDEEAGPCSEGEHDWEKIIGRGIKIVKSASWGPGKGSWVLLLLAFATQFLSGCTKADTNVNRTAVTSGVSRFENEEVTCYYMDSDYGKALQCYWKPEFQLKRFTEDIKQ